MIRLAACVGAMKAADPPNAIIEAMRRVFIRALLGSNNTQLTEELRVPIQIAGSADAGRLGANMRAMRRQ
jgi:hypothetical protein